MKIREPIKLRIHSQGEDAWSMLDEAFKSRQQFSIAGRVFAVANASRRMDAGKIYEVGALLSELPVVAGLSAPSGNPLVTALRDCVSVMERELNGLAVIQPELRQAREALAAAEDWPWSDAKSDPWNGEGLPPVGTWCQVKSPGYKNQRFDRFVGERVFIVAHDVVDADPVAVFRMELSQHEVDYHALIAKCFEPEKTPEQIEAAERAAIAKQACSEIESAVADYNETISCTAAIRATVDAMIEAGYRKQVAP